MKIHDLIILNEFNQLKKEAKKRYDSYIKWGYILLDASDLQYLYNYKKSENECIILMNKWISYGLAKENSYYYKSYLQLFAIKIYY
jgi:hypothetical protein